MILGNFLIINRLVSDVPTSMPSRYILYPATFTLSVDLSHVRVIEDSDFETTLKLLGADGGSASEALPL